MASWFQKALAGGLAVGFVIAAASPGGASDKSAAAPLKPASNLSPVDVKPGDPLERMVRKAPKGTRFHLAPGIYRGVTLRPRDGQALIGPADGPPAILNGAALVTGWRETQGVWVARVPAWTFERQGQCGSTRPMCRERRALVMDGERLTQVESRNALVKGTWVLEGARAVLPEDPAGRPVEIFSTAQALTGRGARVEIAHLTVVHYAPGAQRGALDASQGKGWRIWDTIVTNNHGVGLHLGDETLVDGGSYSRNGQLGIRAEFGRAVLRGVEIAENNWAGYDAGWEAGGTKFLEMTALTIEGACVHGNLGPGLWTDANNANVRMENNLVFANAGDGVKHEISYAAVIRGNRVLYNGFGFHPWLWGAQILVQNSAGTVVEGNWVETGPDGGNGITIIHQDRQSTGGRWFAMDNRIENNTITLRGEARAGQGADFDGDWFWQRSANRFEGNTYRLEDPDRPFYAHQAGLMRFEDLERAGLEPGAILQTSIPPVEPVACADLGGRFQEAR